MTCRMKATTADEVTLHCWDSSDAHASPHLRSTVIVLPARQAAAFGAPKGEDMHARVCVCMRVCLGSRPKRALLGCGLVWAVRHHAACGRRGRAISKDATAQLLHSHPLGWPGSACRQRPVAGWRPQRGRRILPRKTRPPHKERPGQTKATRWHACTPAAVRRCVGGMRACIGAHQRGRRRHRPTSLYIIITPSVAVVLSVTVNTVLLSGGDGASSIIKMEARWPVRPPAAYLHHRHHQHRCRRRRRRAASS